MHFSKKNFKNEKTNINWDELLDLKKNDVDYSMDSFLYVLTQKMGRHVPVNTKSKKRRLA